MPVSSPEARRAPTTVPGALLVALLAVLVALVPLAPAAQAKTPALLKSSKIVAPKSAGVVSGTLRGTKACAVRFPATHKSLRITVQGPLSVKKPRTRKLAVKKGSRSSSCTWRTTSVPDGKYRFTVKAKVRAKGKYWNVSIKRGVTVRNRVVSTAAAGAGPQLGIGNTRYVGRLESPWDDWLTNSGQLQSGWIRQRMWGVVAHSTFFDDKIQYAPNALAYKDLYAIYRGETETLAARPEWVLKDAEGQAMSIPWGCDPGPCPQFAGDIGSPSFRAAWIADARRQLSKGYTGLWIDDANMEMRVGDAAGVEKTPIDPRTGAPMTFANWRRYIAEFLEQIRREIPETQLVANVLWFGGTSIGRDADPFIQRAYTAVDRLNLERGFNDDGLTNGTSIRDIWSVESFMAFIDRMHDRGIPVTLDSADRNRGPVGWEYNLAGFFLVDRGEDAVGELSLKPGTWWEGWNVQLGAPKGDRIRGADGVYRREFGRGLVLLNPPRGEARKVTLPSPMRRVDGTVVSSVTLAPAAGAVLLPL